MMNSDPAMIRLFLRWLDLVGVTHDRVRFRLHIHESADVEMALRHWSDQVGIDPASFLNTILKRHNPATVRGNVGASYHGCLCVEVRRRYGSERSDRGVVRGPRRGSRVSGLRVA
jgi:hypothetical protein